MNNRKSGLLGEDQALKYLLKKGYKMLERNYNGKKGEVDLIMLDKDTIVFVEVKARDNTKFGLPVEAVTPEKQRNIISVAIEFINKHRYFDYNIRFDVVSILRDNIEHIPNAFDFDTSSFPKKYRY